MSNEQVDLRTPLQKKRDKSNIINLSFSFMYEDFWFYYTRDYKFSSGMCKVGLGTIKYLVNNEYDIPIY